MEKCEENLFTALRKNELSLKERQNIAIGVKNGYEYLERIGLLHNDLKPQNVVLKKEENGERTAKLIDFGTVTEGSGKESFRKMGYCRREERYRRREYLCKNKTVFN